jgi:hypothetical protein
VLGSFGNSLGNNGNAPLHGHPNFKAATKDTKKQQTPGQRIECEWSELPYAMMRITAARRPWDGNRVYWRDRNVQLGEVDLNLVKSKAGGDVPTYKAAYGTDEFRREFALHPSLEDDQLRWTAPGISDVQLTTPQLAEKLLSKLVTFYTTGLPNPATTSPASPNLSS